MSAEASPTDFLFTPPAVRSELSVEAGTTIAMGALASSQVEIKRTRCEHLDGRAENVAEHSLMLAKVAPVLAARLYPDLDRNLVACFATVHDDVEIYVGDTPTDMLSNLDPQAKADLEARGLAQLLKDYASIPEYSEVVRQYEEGSEAEARFVRAVDKLMVMLIHIPNQGKVLREHYTYEEFLDYERKLLLRDGHKYGEFEKVIELRRELGQYLADSFLKKQNKKQA